MRYFLEECGYDMSEPSTLLIDNASAIQVAKNPEHQSTMKHVHREYHWIRENVEKGLIRVLHVPGTENVADIFTKPLKRPIFTHLRELLGLRY
jgi:predicted metal-dependent HD superfamily phosphohydrolase